MVNWALEVGPCPRLGEACRVYPGRDEIARAQWFQHGDNPEHRLVVLDSEMAKMDYSAVFERIVAWLKQVHEYEREQR